MEPQDRALGEVEASADRLRIVLLDAITFGLSAGGTAKAAEPGIVDTKQALQCATRDTDFARTGKIVKLCRTFTSRDGESRIETIDLQGKGAIY